MNVKIVVHEAEASGPFLLKLDVPGAEFDALEGAEKILDDCEFVVLEVSFFKFFEGGWITVFVTGILWGLALVIRRYYIGVSKRLRGLDETHLVRGDPFDVDRRRSQAACRGPPR